MRRLRRGGPRPARAGLGADVGRPFAAPAQEVVGDLVERSSAGQVGAGRAHQGDAGRHLGVVAPLAGGVVAEPAARHTRELVGTRGSAELVRNAERVAAGLAEQHSAGPVGLVAGEFHEDPSGQKNRLRCTTGAPASRARVVPRRPHRSRDGPAQEASASLVKPQTCWTSPLPSPNRARSRMRRRCSRTSTALGRIPRTSPISAWL